MPSAESLQDSTISELRAQRETCAKQPDAASAISTEELEKQLLQALLIYDDERIQIIDPIPKMHDFRLGVSCAAMMAVMQRKRVIRDRMLQDHENPGTILGRHSPRLKETDRLVQEARERLELRCQAETLTEQTDQIDTGLRRRQS